MLHLSMHLKNKILLLSVLSLILISWNFVPRLASGQTSEFSEHVKLTAEQVILNNKITNQFQNDLNLLHTDDYFKESRKQLTDYYELLKPPTVGFEVSDPKFQPRLQVLCDQSKKILDYDFKNLSSVCLKQYLDKNFQLYVNDLSEISAVSQEEKQFLSEKVMEANSYSVDFYTENYSAYILHSQYSEIKKQLEIMNDKLYDSLMEVKKYPIKLPNATTTSCT